MAAVASKPGVSKQAGLLLHSFLEGPEYPKTRSRRCLYSESEVLFWVDTSYLGTWTLRAWLVRDIFQGGFQDLCADA